MKKPFDGSFPLTQGFNDPRYRDSYTRFGLLGHNGLDYGCPTWTPILAPHSGTVLEATTDPTGYGNYVKVQSDDYGSVLAHLAKFSVNVGDQVAEGQLIGYSGNSGNSTGPHLHWGFYCTRTRNRSNGFNGYIDQTDWLDIRWPILTITDQTRIPQINNEEVQALRGKMGDLLRLEEAVKNKDQTIKELMDKLENCSITTYTIPLLDNAPIVLSTNTREKSSVPFHGPKNEEVATLLTRLFRKLKELWDYR